MSKVSHATQENFEAAVLNSEVPVVVDFWAPWCGPCKAIAPVLDEISVERADIKIVKVDVDQSPEIAKKYGIRGIPTLCLMVKGKVEATKVGSVTKAGLVAWVDANL